MKRNLSALLVKIRGSWSKSFLIIFFTLSQCKAEGDISGLKNTNTDKFAKLMAIGSSPTTFADRNAALSSQMPSLFPVDVLFLIDDSKSVPRDCGLLARKRRDFPKFILHDIVMRMGDGILSGIRFGVIRYGETPKEILPLSKVSELSSNFEVWYSYLSAQDVANGNSYTIVNSDNTIDQELDDDTDYSSGIAASFKAFDDTKSKKIVVLITDGIFGKESSEKVDHTLEKLFQDDKESLLYVALLCPNSEIKSAWKKEISSDRVVIWDTGSTNDWLNDFFSREEIKQFFPKNSGFIQYGNDATNISVAGFASGLEVNFQSMEIDSSLMVGGIPNPRKVDNTDFIELSPRDGCPSYQLNLSPLLPGDSGFYWLNILEPEMPKMELFVDRDSVLNNQPTSVHVELRDLNMNVDEFPKWRSCYDVDISVEVAQQQIEIINSTNCGVNQSFCSTNGLLVGTWEWRPPSFRETQLVTLNGYLTRSRPDDTQEVRLVSNPILVRFSPNYIDFIDNSANAKNDLRVNFNFDFAVVDPVISLVTDKDSDELRKVNQTCLNILRTDSQGRGAYIYSPNSKQEIIKRIDNNPSDTLVSYELNLERFNVSECGYHIVQFSWTEDENNGIVETVWECDLTAGFVCTKK